MAVKQSAVGVSFQLAAIPCPNDLAGEWAARPLNLFRRALCPRSPQDKKRAGHLNSSRHGSPPGDDFEGLDRRSQEKTESEKPDVNVPPSSDKPNDAIKIA
jgi:hypothetical protein